ncbi:MAG: ribonuclease III [Oscillospiraceae bacterium]|nr:ribonuclease III [Oscillospiraceae bacterium]
MKQTLESRIGYHFRRGELLETALTHSSCANERHAPGTESYERLEFLGDSVLGLVTAEYLFAQTPALPEGRMTRLRAELVCENSLHRTALALGLGEHLRLGRGEELTGGRERVSILADVVEAIIAAIYLDGGMDEAKRFIMAHVLSGAEIGAEHAVADYKTALQELVQRKGEVAIRYELVGESGPDHNKTFSFSVSVDGETVGEGSGRTKKEAEQMAARCALERLEA